MSPFFLKTFKAANACKVCKTEKLNNYSLCRRHLLKARQRWQRWQPERRGLGLCCYCPRRSWHGTLRCRRHREANRLTCLAWAAAHPDRQAKNQAARRQWLAGGRCPTCVQHRPLPEGQRRCTWCRKRHAAYCNGTYVKPAFTKARPYSLRERPPQGPAEKFLLTGLIDGVG